MQNNNSSQGGDGVGAPGQTVSTASRRKKYARHAVKYVRLNISMSPQLITLIDEAAEQDFTTRSELIRTALLWYLRPQGRELAQADPEIILKTLKRRQLQVEMNRTKQDIDIQD